MCFIVMMLAMIEVRRRVHLREIDLKAIERRGTFLGSRIVTDTYYDTPEYRYTTSDIWLRERECKFELKIGIPAVKGGVEQYKEVVDEAAIHQELGLDKKEKDLSKALYKGKIFPYATFQTARRKYQIDEFTIDLDLAYFDDFIYRLADVQLFVSSERKKLGAERSIEDFIKSLGIDYQKPIKPKLIEFLSQKNPTHYQALIASGIILPVS